MLSSKTPRYGVTADTDTRDGDVAVWVRPLGPDDDPFTDDELEAMAVRGVVRELLSEERRMA